ncbi:FkbM family methyltransferase [Coleofasciculus sp. FACHB-1120]|uniref:FkbM family methyltransferase n=1 Tax=Coleofasciculus sp. FACHB-1120 TaxID=2692783 RepID=UPI00168A13AB|nr:FkbM family methyltransferase [Coleofasciculus sp. FACHB-1120]MBD2740764.1 FkbM family methyltransferase [Coleofasciculus sp. FACHB-1120]
MKVLLELKNFFKETIKGSFLDPFVRPILDIVTPPKRSDILNRQDNAFTIEIMSRVLAKDSNCIDVGCNTGDLLGQILHYSPLGFHYAFEPIPRLANRLRKKFPNVEVKQTALSDSETEATFWYVVNAPAVSSLDKECCESHIPNALMEPIIVKTQKLDDVLAPELKIHFIKVDVEGVELQVFRGASRTLKTYKPYLIFESGLINSQEWVDGTLKDGKWHDSRIYDLLVNECGLKIFKLKNWIEGLAPLSQDEFLKCSAWNFVATP